MWRVSILRSLSTGRFYVGCTDRIERRGAEHNVGETKSTSGRGPWEFAYAESFGTRGEA